MLLGITAELNGMETKFLLDSVGHYGFNVTSGYNFQQQDFLGEKKISRPTVSSDR